MVAAVVLKLFWKSPLLTCWCSLSYLERPAWITVTPAGARQHGYVTRGANNTGNDHKEFVSVRPCRVTEVSQQRRERCDHVLKVQTSLRAPKDSAATAALPAPSARPLPPAHALDRDVPLGFLHHYQVTNDLVRGWDIKMECVFQSRGERILRASVKAEEIRTWKWKRGHTSAHTWGFIRQQVHIFVVSHFSFTGIFNVTLSFFRFFFIWSVRLPPESLLCYGLPSFLIVMKARQEKGQVMNEKNIFASTISFNHPELLLVGDDVPVRKNLLRKDPILFRILCHTVIQ